jgi:hypothetical protein
MFKMTTINNWKNQMTDTISNDSQRDILNTLISFDNKIDTKTQKLARTLLNRSLDFDLRSICEIFKATIISAGVCTNNDGNGGVSNFLMMNYLAVENNETNEGSLAFNIPPIDVQDFNSAHIERNYPHL